MLNCYQDIAANIYADYRNNRHKSYAICGCGVSAETLILSEQLSSILADAGWKVILIDMDFQRCVLNPELQENENRLGIADYIRNERGLTDLITTENTRNYCYIGTGRVSPDELGIIFCSGKIESLLAEVNECYDFVVINTPPFSHGPEAKIVCSNASSVVIVVSLGQTTKKELECTKRQIENMKVPIAGIVIKQKTFNGRPAYTKNWR